MTRISSHDAARLLGGVSSETIRDYIEEGLLPAKRIGLRGLYKIEIADLRAFAEQHDRYFDHELADQLEKTAQ